MSESKRLFDQLSSVRMFVFDVDGVLTNGQLLVQEDGHLLRSMNVRDGFAIKRAIDQGYKVCIITGGSSGGVVSRLQNLGVEDVIIKSQDKTLDLNFILKKHDVDPQLVLFMGDDLPDYEVMQMVGMPCCPADAAPEIVKISRYISSYTGGMGCVRDVIQKVLQLNNHWMETESKITQE